MKKYILIGIGLVLFQYRGDIRNFFDPPPDYAAMHEEQVILYSTEWCGYCTQARQLMDAEGIPYYEYDIERSAEGRAQYNRLGGNGVPFMLIDGTPLQGYNRKQILQMALATP